MKVRSAALILAVLASCRGRPSEESKPDETRAVSVTCVAVTVGPLERSVGVRGRVMTRPGGDLPVASLVVGKILEVKVEEGTRVKQGAIIAIVDDLGPRAAALQARAGLARAKSSEAEAEAALNRAKTLQSAGIMSKGDLDTAAARATAAAAGLASGTLGRVEVRSTFDGVVTKIWRGAGAVVDGTAGTPIVQVAAYAHLEFVAEVTEPELAILEEGDDAAVELGGRVAKGKVAALSYALDPKTGLGTARIALNSSVDASQVRIGAFGRGRIQARSLAQALSIPRAAMRGAILDGADVAKCVGGKVTLVHVAIGYRDETRLQVLSGLETGDRVATGDVLGLGEGTSIVETSAEPAPSSTERPSEP